MDDSDILVTDIQSLGLQKKHAYERLDELEQRLCAGGIVFTAFRVLFPSRRVRTIRAEYDQTVHTIHSLRYRMDDIHEKLPTSRLAETYHLWSIENTTSLSQLRRARNGALSRHRAYISA